MHICAIVSMHNVAGDICDAADNHSGVAAYNRSDYDE